VLAELTRLSRLTGGSARNRRLPESALPATSQARPSSSGLDAQRRDRNGVESPSLRTSPVTFEFCSGLIDLVVGVCRHGGGGNRFRASDS
jgi:hypothetical protein